MASGGENFDKRCRDFRRRQNRGISEILGGKKTQVSRPLFLSISWPKAGILLTGRGLTF